MPLMPEPPIPTKWTRLIVSGSLRFTSGLITVLRVSCLSCRGIVSTFGVYCELLFQYVVSDLVDGRDPLSAESSAPRG